MVFFEGDVCSDREKKRNFSCAQEKFSSTRRREDRGKEREGREREREREFFHVYKKILFSMHEKGDEACGER